MTAISSINIIKDTVAAPWNVHVKPFKVTDQITYVGNQWVGAYLIKTSEGLILLDTMCAETSYLLLDDIYQLGYVPTDIKMILLSHAHVDHYGAARMMHELSGAPIYLSREDEEFRHNERAVNAKSSSPGSDIVFQSYPFDVDYYYDDNVPIVLGDVTIRTRLTPGHTPGVTTFFITARQENGEECVAAMHGGVGVLTMSDEYFDESGLPASLRTRFIEDCKNLESEKVDICLASHPAHFPGDFFESARTGDWSQGNPFMDPTGWQRFLRARAKFANDLETKSKIHK